MVLLGRLILLSRFAPITDPDADVNVTAKITQRQREDLRSLAYAKEHISTKNLIALLIRRYLEENGELLQTLSGISKPPVPTVVNPVPPTPVVTPEVDSGQPIGITLAS